MTRNKQLTKRRSKSTLRRKKLKLKKLPIIVISLIFFWWFNNYTLKINREYIYSDKLTQPLKLAVLSDYHVHGIGISKKKILKKLDRINPDAVVILGDMYSTGSPEEDVESAISLMSDIAEEYTAYFVSGEHDQSQSYLNSLSANGVKVMNYKDETVEIRGNKIRFLGIDNAYFSPTFDLTNEFTISDDCYNILLAHIPNYEKYADFGADLTLCADTHGGMFRLPFIKSVYDAGSDTFFPNLRKNAKVYDKGLFEYDGGSMFITSGIGDSPYPVRFFNRPEVVSIDIFPER